MRKLRCFVAMAFNHPDTDKLYRTSLEPEVKALPANCIRVDQIEHQKGIDDFIIEQIEEADFCIADLTYTRPSVYYEAGYAERKIPVIYTVRSDHLANGAAETSRVHFDLQMKNIIQWTDPGDKSFQSRLRKRLRYVTASMSKKLEMDQSILDSRRWFEERSLSSKLELLQWRLQAEARRCGYSVRKLQTPAQEVWKHHVRDLPLTCVGSCVAGDTLKVLVGVVAHKCPPTALRSLGKYFHKLAPVNLTPNGSNRKIAKLDEHYVLISVGALTPQRLMAHCPSLEYSKATGQLKLPYPRLCSIPLEAAPGYPETYYRGISSIVAFNPRSGKSATLFKEDDEREVFNRGRYDVYMKGGPQTISGKTVDRFVRVDVLGGVKSEIEAIEKLRQALQT